MPPLARITLFLGALLGLAGAAQAADTPRLDWLAGDWCGNHGNARIEEHWIAAGQHWLGLSATTAEGMLRDFEYLRIEPRGDSLAYVAQPQGQPPVAFDLVEHGAQRAVFANPQHDFPQRIAYWRDATGLHAQIAGPGKDGTERTLQFDFTLACDD